MSPIVESVDRTFFIIVAISVVFLLGITATMIAFVIRYSRKRHPVAAQINGNTALEVTWTVVPLVLVMAMFYYGYEGFALMRNPPADSLTVHVTARMWDWRYTYENGAETDKLYVPLGRPVKLLLRSLDVVHSFYLPAYRVKEDAVPGRETFLWFKPQALGPSEVFCAEYCGQRHSYMMSQVLVMTPAEFQAWYDSHGKAAALPPAATTLRLFDKHGCVDCHALGSDVPGLLSLRGIKGRKTRVVVAGKEQTLVADAAYIRRAIVTPSAEILAGQADEMPPTDLPAAELEAMVEFLGGLE